MRYIWENYTPEYYFSTKYNRSILEAIQPYINEPNEISVNIKGRLENVFDSQISKLLDSSKHNDDYYNIIIHYLAQLDLVLGTCESYFEYDIILNEIGNGRYGLEVKNCFAKLTPKHKFLVLEYINKYHINDELTSYFDELFFDLFGTINNKYSCFTSWDDKYTDNSAEIYYQKTTDTWFYYCAAEENEYNKNLFYLIKILFADCTKRISPVWGEFCFGLISNNDNTSASNPIIDKIRIL